MMRRGQRSWRRRGTMSIVIVILAMAATAMITGTLSMTTGASTVQLRAMMREQAVFLADAGLEHAMIRLKNDKAWRAGYSNQPLGAGSYAVTLVDSGSDVLVTSTGTVGSVTAQLSLRVGWQ
jgi:hypothetical protein